MAAKDDLDYLRDLAEEGAQAPLLGGRFLAWWGGVVTLAYLIHFAALQGIAGLGAAHIGFIWFGFIAFALAGYFVLGWLMPEKPGRGSAANRAEPVLWRTAGLSIFMLFLGLIGAALVGGNTLHPDASLPLVFAVYAVGLATSGHLSGNRTLSLAGWIALVFVGVTAALFNTPELYLAGAAGAFLTVFVPGLMLLRAEPARIV